MIDITGVNLVEFAKEVYKLSVPRGLGWLHQTSDPLTDEEAKTNIHDGCLHMDYVKGRGCKMNVFKRGDQLQAPDTWYDHEDATYQALLAKFGFAMPSRHEHGCACECADCMAKRVMSHA